MGFRAVCFHFLIPGIEETPQQAATMFTWRWAWPVLPASTVQAPTVFIWCLARWEGVLRGMLGERRPRSAEKDILGDTWGL